QHFIQSVVPDDADIATFSLGKQFVLQDFFCAQAVTTVNQCDMGSDIGQIQCFFNSRVAAADDCDRLVAVEETVTGGAGTDATAHKCLLGRQSQILGGSTGSNDQRITGVLTAITLEVEGALLQIDLVDMVENDLGVKTLGVTAHTVHQLRTLHTIHICRPVINFGGGGQLAALNQSCNHNGIKIGTCCVYSSSVSGRARTKNDQTMMLNCHRGDSLKTCFGTGRIIATMVARIVFIKCVMLLGVSHGRKN